MPSEHNACHVSAVALCATRGRGGGSGRCGRGEHYIPGGPDRLQDPRRGPLCGSRSSRAAGWTRSGRGLLEISLFASRREHRRDLVLGRVRLPRSGCGTRSGQGVNADAEAGGILLAFFGEGRSSDLRYTRYCIVDETHLRHKFYAAACRRRLVLQNREIFNLFGKLAVLDSILLKSGVRELLFQKPTN